MAQINKQMLEKLSEFGKFEARACMNCGSCTAICPMGIELMPRRLFRYVMFGLEDEVRNNTDAIFSCLLCKMCEAKCPSQVQVTENMRLLRSYINTTIFKI